MGNGLFAYESEVLQQLGRAEEGEIVFEPLPFSLNLNVLKPDAELYSVLILQPHGAVKANPQYVGPDDQGLASAKCAAFFELALQHDVDLAVTPEYYCPWDALGQLLASGRFPNERKLWVLGCEAVTREGLNAFIAQHSGFRWHWDQDALNNPGNFLDPVCYLLSVPRPDNSALRVIVVQFKVQRMADPIIQLERDHMIRGTRRYVLSNDVASINLVTIICSDSLDFLQSQLPGDYLHKPFLILHPQLNPNPRHAQFCNYRRDIYMHQAQCIEILCYNWARGTQIPGIGLLPFGGSALYTKSPNIRPVDLGVNGNHKMGLYYTHCNDHHFHSFFFNYDEYAFRLATTKCSQAAAMAALAQRTGPAMRDVLTWHAGTNQWQPNSLCDDGFPSACASIGQDLAPLSDATLEPVDKERLLAVSCGAFVEGSGTPWHNVNHMRFFTIAENEVIRRMTFAHDPESAVRQERDRYLSQYATLRNTIVPNVGLYPPCIADLAGIGYIAYPIDGKYDVNLTATGKEPATVAYLGECSATRAKECFDSAASLLGDRQRRLVVWHRTDNVYKPLTLPDGKYDDDLAEDRRSITKEE
jgi:hypothetical protein